MAAAVDKPVEASSGMASPLLALRGVSKAYGAVDAVRSVELEVERGEFLTLLGPSGSGKTTLLNAIAGFVRPDSGRILLDGVDITKVPPHKRELNTVFQGYALFPHLNVKKNVAFGLRMKGVPKAEAETRTAEALAMVQMESMAERPIDNLSGGQQQRVALARALVNRPRLVLLDEPLSALDAKLRKAMQLELKRIQEESGATFVYVTHDQEEALVMSDRICVVNTGVIEQTGTPDDLYHRPRNRFVAGFIGRNNFLPGVVTHRQGETWFEVSQGSAFRLTSCDVTGEAVVAVRPERLAVATDAGSDTLPAEVARTRFLGDRIEVDLRLGGGTVVSMYMNGTHIEPANRVLIRFNPDHCQVLAQE